MDTGTIGRVEDGAARTGSALRQRILGQCGRAGAATLAATASLLVAGAGWPSSAAAAATPLSIRAGAPEAVGVIAEPGPALVPGGAADRPARTAFPRRLLQADVLVVSPHALPPGAVRAVARMRGVAAAEAVDAARVAVNGRYAAVLGVDVAGFRRFAAKPTARDEAFWRAVSDGGVGVSYTMGRQDKLPVGSTVSVAGRRREELVVGGLGTVGIAGVDAVISQGVAASLGFPMGNALVVSAPRANLSALAARIRAAMPKSALAEQLVASQASAGAGQPGAANGAGAGGLLTPAQDRAMLRAALSAVGRPYVWGAAGPTSFDCSGLVQWSFAQAGIVMPRVAADQARTGPSVPLSRLRPGDLLFYHTDPTAPGYISHVAIYLGRGLMIQAPEPGMNVEIVPADFGSEFAGALAVSPRIAARVAASPVG